MTIRSGCRAPSWISVGSRPEEEEPRMTSAGAASAMAWCSLRFSSIALRRAFLDEVGRAPRPPRPSRRTRSRSGLGALGQADPGQRRPGVGDGVAQRLLAGRRRVPGDHVQAMGQRPRGPAAADDAAADDAEGPDAHAAWACPFGLRPRWLRASAGVSAFDPIASMMVRARSTRLPLEAKTPLSR